MLLNVPTITFSKMADTTIIRSQETDMANSLRASLSNFFNHHLQELYPGYILIVINY